MQEKNTTGEQELRLDQCWRTGYFNPSILAENNCDVEQNKTHPEH